MTILCLKKTSCKNEVITIFKPIWQFEGPGAGVKTVAPNGKPEKAVNAEIATPPTVDAVTTTPAGIMDDNSAILLF